MGFHEDDRIRHKNHASNQACVIFTNYRKQMWSHGDIAAAAEDELLKDPNNRVAYELLKMAIRATSNPIDSSNPLD